MILGISNEGNQKKSYFAPTVGSEKELTQRVNVTDNSRNGTTEKVASDPQLSQFVQTVQIIGQAASKIVERQAETTQVRCANQS